MPTVDIDGSLTRDEITGSGPPILLMAPGGFDSPIEKTNAFLALSIGTCISNPNPQTTYAIAF
jgi:hypothetical protein